MQTLKTAAIVVLLVTIIFGAYSSLTTPPEQLPQGVEEMLVFDDGSSMSIDSSLPPSLGELQINTGFAASDPNGTTFGEPEVRQPNADPANGMMSAAASVPEMASIGQAETSPPASPSYEFAEADFGGPSAGLGTPSRSIPTRNAQADHSPGANMGLSSGGTPASPASFSLSDSGASSGSTADRSYAQTGRSFDLPDPNSVSSSFKQDDPNRFVSPESVAQTSATRGQGASLAPGMSNIGLANAIRTADRQYTRDQRKEALATLSLFYNVPNMSGEERTELIQRLDPLAAQVIYSKEHLLESPHRVGQNETLIEVAQRYEVPWQLLANINEIQDPVTILPGTELKVVRGPFRAEVNLTYSELTLFLGDFYAGRFPVGIGNDPAPKPGTFTVQDKQTSRTFYDAAGSPIPPGSPDNPYGNAWLDLGGQLCIHGSPSTTSPTTLGCISLAADSADDLFAILSQGSSVTIKR